MQLNFWISIKELELQYIYIFYCKLCLKLLNNLLVSCGNKFVLIFKFKFNFNWHEARSDSRSNTYANIWLHVATLVFRCFSCSEETARQLHIQLRNVSSTANSYRFMAETWRTPLTPPTSQKHTRPGTVFPSIENSIPFPSDCQQLLPCNSIKMQKHRKKGKGAPGICKWSEKRDNK